MKSVKYMTPDERQNFRFENLSQEDKEQIIKEYYSWIFNVPEEQIGLHREIDEVLAPTYEDPYIYQNDLIERLSRSKAMVRTKNITQQGLQMNWDKTTIFNRFEHGIGTSYLALEENIMLWIQNKTYREIVEKNDLKLKIFCIEIAELTHDMGHQILSHLIEHRLLGKLGVHEDIGKKILLEDEEINQILIDFEIELVINNGEKAITFGKYLPKQQEEIKVIIQSELNDDEKRKKLKLIINESIIKKELRDVLKNGVLNSKEHTEGNFDVDRKDYLRRNYFYYGIIKKYEYPMYKRFFFEVDENGDFIIDESGQKKLATKDTPLNRIKIIDAYEDKDFEKVEGFIKDRIKSYEEGAWSPSTQAAEIAAGKFFEVVAESNEPLAHELTEFFKYLREKKVEDYDINVLEKSDEIKMYLDIINIAENADSDFLKNMATIVLPGIDILMEMMAERLNLIERRKEGFKDLSPLEEEIISKLYELKTGDTKLARALKNCNLLAENVMIVAGNKNIEIVRNLYPNVFRDIKEFKLTGYNADNGSVIFWGQDGEFVPLEEHPRRTKRWGKKNTVSIKYTYAIIPDLRREQFSSEYISEVVKRVKRYIEPVPKPKEGITFNPSRFKTETDISTLYDYNTKTR